MLPNLNPFIHPSFHRLCTLTASWESAGANLSTLSEEREYILDRSPNHCRAHTLFSLTVTPKGNLEPPSCLNMIWPTTQGQIHLIVRQQQATPQIWIQNASFHICLRLTPLPRFSLLFRWQLTGSGFMCCYKQSQPFNQTLKVVTVGNLPKKAVLCTCEALRKSQTQRTRSDLHTAVSDLKPHLTVMSNPTSSVTFISKRGLAI